MLADINPYHPGSRLVKMNYTYKEVTDKDVLSEAVWGQMVYVGSPDQWMTPEWEDKEPEGFDDFDEEPFSHLLAFLSEPEFTGDAYFPILDCEMSPPSPSQATCESSPHRPVFHLPTSEELAAHFESLEEISKLRALEADMDAEQKIRDAADGRRALPPSPPPRVFVPPLTPNKPVAEISPSKLRLTSRPPSRAGSPFRMIPSLPVRFPLLFGSDGDAESEDADVSDGTFSDIEWSTDRDSAEQEPDVDLEGIDPDVENAINEERTYTDGQEADITTSEGDDADDEGVDLSESDQDPWT
ncbi:hypothetical protein DFH06DRAFT_1317284 [Mycena polygramma]|nr:hypothetical protein DFH06DRAFT_1317284 [Mycena polygramma]